MRGFLQYEESMRAYWLAKAKGQWKDAHVALLLAIDACPVAEALPTLSTYREEAAERARPVGRLQRLLGVRA